MPRLSGDCSAVGDGGDPTFTQSLSVRGFVPNDCPSCTFVLGRD
jgi:hypothetical protein